MIEENMMKIDESMLPVFVRHDIDALLEAEEQEKATGQKCLHMDCLLDEVYGSVNAAYWDGMISKGVAEYLRKKYLGIDDPLQSREISKEEAEVLRNSHRKK